MKLPKGVRFLEGKGLSSNSYFLDGPDGVLCIDAGTDANAFKRALNGKKSHLLLTHAHADHWLAAASEKMWLHAADIARFSDINAIFQGVATPSLAKLPKKIKWGSFALEVLETPGHTPGSVCFLERTHGLLFSGDTLFARGCHGRTDLPCGNNEDMQASLELIESLDYALLLPGHDEIEECQ
jgi:hydroxyacylglutathione hydrolase